MQFLELRATFIIITVITISRKNMDLHKYRKFNYT